MSDTGLKAALTPDASWYFNPQSWWVKTLRFLHLLEDQLVQVSHTGIVMWATSFNNIHTLMTSTNVASITGGILANVAGLWAHTAKRAQTLNASK